MLDNIYYEKNLLLYYNKILLSKCEEDIILLSENFEKELDYDSFYPIEFLSERFSLNYFEKNIIRFIYLNSLHSIPQKNDEFSIEEILNLLKIQDKITGLKLFSSEEKLQRW